VSRLFGVDATNLITFGCIAIVSKMAWLGWPATCFAQGCHTWICFNGLRLFQGVPDYSGAPLLSLRPSSSARIIASARSFMGRLKRRLSLRILK
jgi:hypothetical protein